MTTNRECINQVEYELEEMQDKIQRMELGINDKLAHIEATLSKLTDSINTSKAHQALTSKQTCQASTTTLRLHGPVERTVKGDANTFSLE